MIPVIFLHTSCVKTSEWVKSDNVCCRELTMTHSCCIWNSRCWQKSSEWKGNNLIKQMLFNTFAFYLSGGQITEKTIQKQDRLILDSRGVDWEEWIVGPLICTFVFLREAGTNYWPSAFFFFWPSAFCKLLSPSNGENSHVGECLCFSLKAVLQIWRMSREENHKEKHYGGCKGKKHNFKGMVSKRVKTQRQTKVEAAHSQCQSLERTRPGSASTSGEPQAPQESPAGMSHRELPFHTPGDPEMLVTTLKWQKILKQQSNSGRDKPYIEYRLEMVGHGF